MSPTPSDQPHSEAVAALLRTFGLIAFTTPAGLVGVSLDSMSALFGETDRNGNYAKAPKLARLQCIADNVDWDWTEADGENGYLVATYHTPFVIEGK